jgi:hypothetical protein
MYMYHLEYSGDRNYGGLDEDFEFFDTFEDAWDYVVEEFLDQPRRTGTITISFYSPHLERFNGLVIWKGNSKKVGIVKCCGCKKITYCPYANCGGKKGVNMCEDCFN